MVLTHTNADFDSLASAVAVAKVWKIEHPEHPTHVVMPRGSNPLVSRFLAYHKHLLPLRGYATIQADDLQRVGVVDTSVAVPVEYTRPALPPLALPHPSQAPTRYSPPQPSRHPPEADTHLWPCAPRRQSRNRLGPAEKWLASASHVVVYDHHVEVNGDINPNELVLDDVGSLTTVLVEKLYPLARTRTLTPTRTRTLTPTLTLTLTLTLTRCSSRSCSSSTSRSPRRRRRSSPSASVPTPAHSPTRRRRRATARPSSG